MECLSEENKRMEIYLAQQAKDIQKFLTESVKYMVTDDFRVWDIELLITGENPQILRKVVKTEIVERLVFFRYENINSFFIEIDDSSFIITGKPCYSKLEASELLKSMIDSYSEPISDRIFDICLKFGVNIPIEKINEYNIKKKESIIKDIESFETRIENLKNELEKIK